jgi:hypothetical protein
VFIRNSFAVFAVLIYGCGLSSDGPRFNTILTDKEHLNGQWYLYQKIIPKTDSKDIIFPIDSMSFDGERFTIDIDNMLFKREKYPFNFSVSKYRMIISGDTLKLKSGAFQNGKPLYKETLKLSISEDFNHLRVYNLNEKEISMYHKR